MFNTKQLAYALYDQKLHTGQSANSTELYAQVTHQHADVTRNVVMMSCPTTHELDAAVQTRTAARAASSSRPRRRLALRPLHTATLA